MERDVGAAGRKVKSNGWESGFGHASHPSATKLPNPVDRYECEDRRVCSLWWWRPRAKCTLPHTPLYRPHLVKVSMYTDSAFT